MPLRSSATLKAWDIGCYGRSRTWWTGSPISSLFLSSEFRWGWRCTSFTRTFRASPYGGSFLSNSLASTLRLLSPRNCFSGESSKTFCAVAFAEGLRAYTACWLLRLYSGHHISITPRFPTGDTPFWLRWQGGSTDTRSETAKEFPLPP